MLALLAVVPEDYDTRGREAFPISEMAGKSFIISAEGVDYDVHEALEGLFVRGSVSAADGGEDGRPGGSHGCA